jgi:glycosyltransferase involved in cell wall biosynthesis
VIVVDDCSSDGTADYVCSLADKVVFLCNSQHSGHSSSVNLGIKSAQGDWIKLLDDDDYLTPNCIETMLQAIKLHPQASICSCQAIGVDSGGRLINRTRLIGEGKAFYIPQADLHYGMLLEQVPIGTTSQVALRRDVFLQSGGWNLNLNICDDIDSWIRMAQLGDAIFINQCLVHRTIWSGSYNQKSSLFHRRDINILMKEKIYDLVSEKHKYAIPTRRDIINYIKLYWFLVALKKNQIFTALMMAFPVVLSWAAWKLLFDTILARKWPDKNPNISKVLLIP